MKNHDRSVLMALSIWRSVTAGEQFIRDHWRVLILILLVLASFNFSYLYFYPFDEGHSEAPTWVRGVKDVVLWLVLAALLWSERCTLRLSPVAVSFLPFLAIGYLLYLLDPSFVALRGNILRITPGVVVFAILVNLGDRRFFDAALRTLYWLALLQVACAFIFAQFGIQLWEWGLFVGTIGNPNSFALFINLGAAVAISRILQCRGTALLWPFVAFVAFAMAIQGTASFSQVIVLYGLLFLGALFEAVRMHRVMWRSAGLTLIAWVVSQLDFLAYSVGTSRQILLAIIHYLPGNEWLLRWLESLAFRMPDSGGVSRSLTLRIEMHRTAFEVLTRDVSSFLFGDVATAGYHELDGMHIQLLANGGALWFLSFAIPSTYLAVLAMRVRHAEQLAFPLMLAALSATMLASRVLQYFPFDVLYFLVAAGVWYFVRPNEESKPTRRIAVPSSPT